MEIIPNVHQIPGLRGANAYLLLGEGLMLVDAGMPGSAGAILGYAESLGLAASDLARIVITHHHMDHVGCLAALREKTPARILAHPADAPFIAGEKPAPPPSGALIRVLMGLAGLFMPPSEPVPVDESLEDGCQLDLLGGATIVHVPGHTPGSIALQLPVEGVLICGDVIDHRRNRLGPPSKPFTDDMDQAVASLRRLAELDYDVLCPGHGPPMTSGADEGVRAMVRTLP